MPGNLGLFQMLYALAAQAFGLDRDQAIAVALLIQIQQIVPVTLIGVGLAPQLIFGRGALRTRPSEGLPGAAIAGEGSA